MYLVLPIAPDPRMVPVPMPDDHADADALPTLATRLANLSTARKRDVRKRTVALAPLPSLPVASQVRWQERHKYKRVHFTCDGPVSLMGAVIPGEFLRVGDTASGTSGTPGDGDCFIWMCARVVQGYGAEWECYSEWTEAEARAAIDAADLVVVVSDNLTVIKGGAPKSESGLPPRCV